MFAITVNFSLRQVNKLIHGHQTFEPRKPRRLNQFYATFALVRSFSHALIMQNQKKKPIGTCSTCSTWSPCKEKGHGTLSIFLNRPWGLFLESPANFSGPESCFVFAVFTFKIKVSKILKLIQWNYQLITKQNWLVCGLGTALLFKRFGF